MFEVMKNNLVLKIISPDRVKICTVHSPVYMISCNDYSKMNMNFVSSEVKFYGKFVIFSYLLQLDNCLIFEGGLAKNDENYVVHGRYQLFMDQNGELFPWNIYLWRIIPLRVPM